MCLVVVIVVRLSVRLVGLIVCRFNGIIIEIKTIFQNKKRAKKNGVWCCLRAAGAAYWLSDALTDWQSTYLVAWFPGAFAVVVVFLYECGCPRFCFFARPVGRL